MKIGLSSDWHWSQFSSIIRTFGDKYSTRLEHLINSINWAEQIFVENGCYAHICLGDAFDKTELNAQEISALKEINWGKIYHCFIVGNHEMASSDLSTNTVNLFSLMPHSFVYSSPTMLNFGNETNIFILPYILNSNRKSLKEYLKDYSKPDIILSHNDISGIQLGGFVSKEGFSLDEIKENCNLFINGHLHNGCKLDNGIYNIGNLCGQNFNEDAFLYSHDVWILDTDTKEINVYKNPYSFNFYKIDFVEKYKINDVQTIISKLLNNVVCTIKCKENDYEYLHNIFNKEKNKNIIESKFIIEYESNNFNVEQSNSLSVDHLYQFEKYVKEKFDVNDLLLSELQEVLK